MAGCGLGVSFVVVLLCACAHAAHWGPLDIKTVHVVQGCHLDVGFANSAVGIINLWFDQHIPNALKVAEELRNDAKSNARLMFTAQSYVISLYLDCPPGMGLHCPTPDQVAAFKAGAARGDITWHAFPFNAELEMYNPTFVDEGVALTHSLDASLGLPPKFTLSQRDVPGTTRAAIPILRRNGVQGITVGVNTASAYPQVPKAFVWTDPVSADSLYAMWHPRGYGGYTVDEAVIVPGLTHAMVTDWNGDNAGPYDANTYKLHFAQIQLEFPNAQIVASTFDNFTQQLPAVHDALPVITSEIGDTWIYGCPSDPRKVAVLRAFNRAWEKYLAGGGQRDPVYLNATRLALKNGEHTWGKDVKSNLKDNAHWSNADFEWARTVGPDAGQYGILEQSWWEQRDWGITYPLQALTDANHPLLDILRPELAALLPTQPDPVQEGYTPVSDPSKPISCGDLLVAFDAATGAVTTLHNTKTGQDYAAAGSPLLELVYRTYSQADYTQFIHDYMNLTNPPDWALHDFGKPDDNVSQHAFFPAQLLGVWSRVSAQGTDFLLKSVLANNSATYLGGAQVFWLSLTIPTSASAPLVASLGVFNKTTTRLPEAMFVRFAPPGSATAAWTADKLGSSVDLRDVVDGGSKHIHGVQAGFTAKTRNITLTVTTTDAGIITPGQPDGLPTPTTASPDFSQGTSVMLWDNLWGTNYVMWWPYFLNGKPVEGEENALFRFSLSLS